MTEQKPNVVPEWLEDLILRGLQRLLTLRLRNSPAAETIRGTAHVWVAAIATRNIAWDHDLDAERVKRAFLNLCANCEQWPAPATFLANLPPRAETALKALPQPHGRKVPPEIRKQLTDLLGKMRRNG